MTTSREISFELRKGLDLPLRGAPPAALEDGPRVGTVAILGDDYVGLRPSMATAVGDRVKLGSVLFTDKKNPGVQFTSPGCGTVTAIHRGPKRRFESLVIELDGDDEETFAALADIAAGDSTSVRDTLIRSGLWTALRTRPFSRVPPPDQSPSSIFVTAIDTQPLAPDPTIAIARAAQEFAHGLRALRTLTEGSVFVCKRKGASIDAASDVATVVEFDGPHPAGLAGTHIHFVDPVSDTRTVWHIGYQDVIAIGHLFTTGRLSVERVVGVTGPAVEQPRLLLTRTGAHIPELVAGQLADPEARVLSGSVLSGRIASEHLAFLGRYHQQITALSEGRERTLLGWLRPGFDRFSVTHAYAGTWRKPSDLAMTTSTGGSTRAMVPIGTYERVMPLDVLPTYLLRALITGDTDQARALGCLELDEEDLALCSFVCPGKYDYGVHLRRTLDEIEREG